MVERRETHHLSATAIDGFRCALPSYGRAVSPRTQARSCDPRATKQPDGQITSDFRKSCQAPDSKIFRFSRRANQRYDSGHPVLPRGALAIVTNVGRVAVDATVATDERG